MGLRARERPWVCVEPFAQRHNRLLIDGWPEGEEVTWNHASSYEHHRRYIERYDHQALPDKAA
jgi:hypothetical protein